MTAATIDDFNAWCAAVDVSPRLAILKIANYDHAASRMLETLLLWGKNQNVANNGGWFYRTQGDWEAEDGITRRVLPRVRRVLQTIGLDTAVKRVRLADGKRLSTVATHYMLDVDKLKAAFDARFVKSTKGAIHKRGNRELHPPRERKDSIPQSLQTESAPPVPEPPAVQDDAPTSDTSKPDKPRDLILEAVARGSFDIKDYTKIGKSGGRAAKLSSWIKREYPGATEVTVDRFYRWYADKYPDIDAPRGLDTFTEHFVAFHEWATAKKAAEQKQAAKNDELTALWEYERSLIENYGRPA